MTVGREPFSGFPPPNAYVVVGNDATVLIDSGWENEADHDARVAFLANAGGPPLTEILLTHHHPDHAGGALALRQATGAPVTAHPLDREKIESERFGGKTTIDGDLNAGDTRDLGGLSLQVLFTPGHTSGCLSIYIPERGAVMTTDTVMQISTTALRPRDGNLADYVKSLEYLQTIDAKTMYPGHGGPINDPAGRLKQLIEHRQQREQELRDALADGPQTVKGLRERVYAGLPEVRHPLAEAQLTTGLLKLIDEGAVREDSERYSLA
jgi:ribonuclease/clavin/mitogillin